MHTRNAYDTHPTWQLTCQGAVVAFGCCNGFAEPIWGKCVSADPEVEGTAEMVFYMHLAACKQAKRDRRDSWEAEAVLARKEAAAKAEDAVREWIAGYCRTATAECPACQGTGERVGRMKDGTAYREIGRLNCEVCGGSGRIPAPPPR